MIAGHDASAYKPHGIKNALGYSSFDVDGLLLDIYGNTTEDIKVCKQELDRKLDKALQTMIWSDKPTYECDRVYIPKLSSAQVCTIIFYYHLSLNQS